MSFKLFAVFAVFMSSVEPTFEKRCHKNKDTLRVNGSLGAWGTRSIF